jgi:hypothetical protein
MAKFFVEMSTFCIQELKKELHVPEYQPTELQ